MTDKLPVKQSVYSRSGETLVRGVWDPRVLVEFVRTADVEGRRVLDMGANTAGLSIELSRRGATVYAAEPQEDFSVAQQLAREEGLSIEFGRESLFESHMLGKFDVILCFGLLYHFRSPTYVLDYLSSLGAQIIYLSTQTAAGDELKLMNRAAGVLGKKKELPHGTRGWHPTHPMLVRMLEASGFNEIESLTERSYNFPEIPPGATNSAYYRAKTANQVLDPLALHQAWEPRWGAGEALEVFEDIRGYVYRRPPPSEISE